MLIRISLIVAIIAGLAVAVLNFTQVKDKVTTLQTNLKEETAQHAKFLRLYTNTDKELKKTVAELKQTKATLSRPPRSATPPSRRPTNKPNWLSDCKKTWTPPSRSATPPAKGWPPSRPPGLPPSKSPPFGKT